MPTLIVELADVVVEFPHAAIIRPSPTATAKLLHLRPAPKLMDATSSSSSGLWPAGPAVTLPLGKGMMGLDMVLASAAGFCEDYAITDRGSQSAPELRP